MIKRNDDEEHREELLAILTGNFLHLHKQASTLTRVELGMISIYEDMYLCLPSTCNQQIIMGITLHEEKSFSIAHRQSLIGSKLKMN